MKQNKILTDNESMPEKSCYQKETITFQNKLKVIKKGIEDMT